MTLSPEPEHTPDGPAYEGRRLPRPDEEVVDQGAAFDVTTLVTRRRVLALVGAGVGAAALAACGTDSGSTAAETGSTTSGSSTTSDGEIPEETNGPYPADGTTEVNVLEESGIVRSDLTSSLDGGAAVEGVPLAFTFQVTDLLAGAPFEGAAVYLWQCDAEGRYSMYTEGVEDETFLRGVQVADADGAVTFQTIVPGCYAGRWPHLHFEVYPDLDSATDVAHVIATSQVAFPAEILADIYALDVYAGSAENLAGVGTAIEDDGLFGDGDWSLQVPEMTGSAAEGYVATLAVGIDTDTQPSAGGGMGGGPGGPGGPGGDRGPGGEPPSGEPPASR